MSKKRFYAALACYIALAILAFWSLDGSWRLAVWIFLGGLAVKSWIAVLRSS